MSHHSLTSALTVMGNLLKNLKYQMFIHVAADHAVRAVGATVLMEEYMDASNFGVSLEKSTCKKHDGCIHACVRVYV